MAGAVILIAGWIFLSGGATTGSLAYSYLPDRFRTALATPNARLFATLGGLMAVNHVRAHRHVEAFYKAGGRDISGFPMEMYTQNLALIGYGLSTSLSEAFFRRLNRANMTSTTVAGPLLLGQPTTATPEVSRGLCSLYAAGLCIVPLPLSWPLAFLYIMAISI